MNLVTLDHGGENKEAQQLSNFETRKKEILDILNDFITVLEREFFSFSGIDIIDTFLYNIPKDFRNVSATQLSGLNISVKIPNDNDIRKLNRRLDLGFFEIIDEDDMNTIIHIIGFYIISTIGDFIKEYTYDGNGVLLLNVDEYRNLFSQRREMSPKERVNYIIDNFGNKLSLQLKVCKGYSDYEAGIEGNKLKGKLQKLQRINPNIIGYMIIKSLQKDIKESDEKSFDIFSGFLQNNYMFDGTGFGKRFNEFFAKNIFSLSLDAQYKIIGTPEGENFLKQLLIYNGGNKQEKLSLLIFVIEYYKGKFSQISKDIYTECIKLIYEKIGVNGFLNQTQGIELKNLIKIYDFYKRNKKILELNFDVEKAFEEYIFMYSKSDFEIYTRENFCIYPNVLPYIYVKKSIQSYISRISSNILEEKNTREKNEMKIRGVKTKKGLKTRKSKSLKNGDIPLQTLSQIDLSNISMSFFSGDLPGDFLYSQNDFSMSCMDIVDRKAFEEYYKIKKEKPEKNSENAQRLREDRKDMKMASNPLIIRQRLYSMIIGTLLYTKHGPQKWPSIGEELSEKRRIAFEKKREKEALDEELNQKPKEKNGFILVNQDGDDNLPF